MFIEKVTSNDNEYLIVSDWSPDDFLHKEIYNLSDIRDIQEFINTIVDNDRHSDNYVYVVKWLWMKYCWKIDTEELKKKDKITNLACWIDNEN